MESKFWNKQLKSKNILNLFFIKILNKNYFNLKNKKQKNVLKFKKKIFAKLHLIFFLIFDFYNFGFYFVIH